jgi:hypothetical protein
MRYLCFHLVVQLYSLTACFKPRRALLLASEINITSEAFEAILEQNREGYKGRLILVMRLSSLRGLGDGMSERVIND